MVGFARCRSVEEGLQPFGEEDPQPVQPTSNSAPIRSTICASGRYESNVLSLSCPSSSEDTFDHVREDREAVHHAFGHSGGTGCIDDRRQIVRPGGRVTG